MAIYYFNAKILSKNLGHNAVAASAYRSGSRLRCKSTGTVKNYCRKAEVQYSIIHTPEDAPSWTHDREQLWNTVESSETRKNSQLAREIVLGIPIELTSECRSILLDGFVREAFVSLGMIADYSIHDKAGNSCHSMSAEPLELRRILFVAPYSSEAAQYEAWEAYKHGDLVLPTEASQTALGCCKCLVRSQGCTAQFLLSSLL